MNGVFVVVLFMGVLYEATANIPYRQHHRRYRQNSEPLCVHNLCSNVQYYPFESISDAVNEVRQILSTRPLDENRLRELDPEVYNFSYQSDVSVQNLPEDVGDCQTEVQEFYPQEGHVTDERSGRRHRYFIVNIPSLRQDVMNMQCNCHNSVHNKCGQAYRKERLLSLPAYKTHFNVRDFSIQTYLVPYGCTCSS